MHSFLVNSAKDNVYLIEFRHSFGSIFNDDSKILELEEEIDFLNLIVSKIQDIYPKMTVKFIVQSMKKTKQVVIDNLNLYEKILTLSPEFVVGFDTVGEEDTSFSLSHFSESLNNHSRNLILHAGESESRYNYNLFDAVSLNPIRIGHALGLAMHSSLISQIRKNDIGIELCPISNFVLGYIHDLRWHPGRMLMSQGLGLTLNSDGPTFWGVEDLSLEYVYAFLSWELNLKEVKQFALNAIKYSSLTQLEKIRHYENFYEDWHNFILDTTRYINSI